MWFRGFYYINMGQMAERLGNQAINPKVGDLIPAVQNNIVSLGKALHFTFLGRMSLYLTYCKSLWVRASAKCKC